MNMSEKEYFLSDGPDIQLVNIFSEPYNNAIATARTCYSSKIIDLKNVVGEGLKPEKQTKRLDLRDRIASSIFQAGHHTTIQHAHIQFTMSRVSRHFIWSFLHAAPFYNSEQQSQRYVSVKPANVIIPKLSSDAQGIYEQTVAFQMESYQRLTEKLMPLAAEHFYKIFPARRKYHDKYEGTIKKKAQEVARYVLPVGTFANLYHTISLVTLFRYYNMCQQFDVPTETQIVVEKMMQAVLKYDPLLEKFIEEPLPLIEMPESPWLFATRHQERQNFIQRFDQSLDGKVSKLIDYKINQEQVLAESVREVLGLTSEQLNDELAIERVLNPASNRILHTTLNNTTLSKLSRTLFHANYTFRKKLSHTADSQDQRHRMTPASRPVLGLHLTDEPDYITPRLILEDESIHREYQEVMSRVWDGINRLKSKDVPLEFVSYLLPNAVSVRFSESGDLLNMHHKLKMRLCYNAQEEIWQASLDELEQIRAINPLIGQYLLPPCGIRKLGNHKPYCPEGDRYCGVPVWTLQPEQYQRVI